MPGSAEAPRYGNCFTCQTRDRTEWCVLVEDELRLIDSGKSSRKYLPGEAIFHEGDRCKGVYCIESGMIGVRKTDAEGNSVLLSLATPGDTLGYRALISDEEFRASGEALEASTICFIDRGTVLSLLERNPALGLRFLKRASSELGDAEERILHTATLSVRARFAHLLTVLNNRYGTSDDNGSSKFDLPLSRHDLAAMIGTTPESMSRTIRKLEDEGVAHFTGRAVNIPNLELLIQEFESDNLI